MIKAASLYTFEIDEPDLALAELKAQLDEKLALQKNTVAILQCDPDYIESGLVARLCDAFGFPVVGGTSVGQATNGAFGDLMLTLLVLTSDDVEFLPAHTAGLADDLYGATRRACHAAAAGRADTPALILAFPPIIEAYAGDSYVEAFERLYGKTPVFGSLAVEDAITDYSRCATVCGCEVLTEEMTFVLVYGAVAPRFFVATVPRESTLVEKGVITKAKENVVYEINGMRAIDYFERVGLAQGGKLRPGIDFVPFLVTLETGEAGARRPFVRGLIRFEADGAAVCRGTMYEGATFTIGSNSGADVINATMETVEQIGTQPDVSAALLFSCIVRRMTLGADPQLELAKVREALPQNLPFMLAYSGGEIAPTAMEASCAVNRFHNYSFIGCLF